MPPSEVNKPNTSDNELKLRPSGSGLGETSGIASNSQRRVTKRSRRHIEADEEEDVKPDLSTIGFDDVHSEEDIEVLEVCLPSTSVGPLRCSCGYAAQAREDSQAAEQGGASDQAT